MADSTKISVSETVYCPHCKNRNFVTECLRNYFTKLDNWNDFKTSKLFVCCIECKEVFQLMIEISLVAGKVGE